MQYENEGFDIYTHITRPKHICMLHICKMRPRWINQWLLTHKIYITLWNSRQGLFAQLVISLQQSPGRPPTHHVFLFMKPMAGSYCHAYTINLQWSIQWGSAWSPHSSYKVMDRIYCLATGSHNWDLTPHSPYKLVLGVLCIDSRGLGTFSYKSQEIYHFIWLLAYKK